MTRLRRTLSCLLAAGLTAPLLATVTAAQAFADTAVSGIALDTYGQLVNWSSSYHSPGYALSATAASGGGYRLVMQSATSGSPVGDAVTIVPPTGSTFGASQTYALSRFPDATHAGLTVGSSSCSLEGSLTVDAITTDPADGHLTSLSAAFQARCVGTTNWLYGTLRDNAGDYVAAATSSGSTLPAFDATTVGQQSPTKTLRISATGTAPLVLGTAGLTGTNPGDFRISDDTCSGATVAAGSSCSLTLAFAPTAGGYRNASFTIGDNTARGARTVSLVGTGIAPPGPVSALATQTASDGVRVTWSAPADNGGSSAISYVVYRGTDSGALSRVGTVSDPSYADVVDADTATGTTYYYAVAAANPAGEGPQSSPVAGTTPDSVLVPSATRVVVVDHDHGTPDQDTSVIAFAAAGDTVRAFTNGNQLTVTTSRGIGLTLTGTAPITAGTYPVGPSADGTHLTLYASCQAGSGTVTLGNPERNANGDIVVLDLDATWACGSDTHLNRLSARLGSGSPYEAVTVVGGDAGKVVVGKTGFAHSTYTNSGTMPVSVSAVSVTAPDGSAAVDWALPLGGATCTGTTLQPGESCTTDVALSPSSGGLRPASIVYTDSTAAGSHTRALTGTGTVLPAAPASAYVTRIGGQPTVSWSYTPAAGQDVDTWEVLAGPDADHLGVIATLSSPAYSFTDPDTADGHRVYRVRGTNAAGTGPGRDVAVDLGLEPAQLSGTSAVRFARLTWQPSSKLPPNPITGWRVYRGTRAIAQQALTDTSDTSAIVSAPAAGQHFYFAVAPLMGSVVGPRSSTFDLVGPSSQLVGIDDNGITMMSLTGAKTLTLTQPGYAGYEAELAVSPRGTQVAYLFCSGNLACDVWVRDAAGGNPVQLTRTSTPKLGVAWSQDGTKIAFTEYSQDFSSSSLVTMTSSGAGLKTVPYSNGLSSPSWLSSTTLVAEDDTSDAAPLVKVALANGARTPLASTSGGLSPAVRPDGTEVAYELFTGSNSNAQVLRVVNLRTGAVRAVPTPGGASLTTPVWSRDQATLYTSDGSNVVASRSNGTGYASYATGGRLYSLAVSTPDISGPAVRLGGVRATTLGASVTPSFTATDANNGVASYTLSYRRAADNSGFSAPTTLTLTAPRAIAVAKGYTYCFSVRATDRAANVSAPTAEQCTVVPLDDRSLTRSSTFATVTGSAFYAGTAMRATAKGATLTRPSVTSVRQLFLVATTCPTCGTLDVLVGSTRVASVNLASTTTANRKVIALPAFSVRSGTVTLRVTSSGKTVYVDGLGVRK
jgi:hypothetical protein